MDGGEQDAWSGVAETWAELWGDLAAPAGKRLLDETGVGPGTHVLDVGCGSGELAAAAAARGAVVRAADPAPGMVRRARARCPGADVRTAGWDDLPWGDGELDVVLAVNALQLADDPEEALREAVRVGVPGALVGVAGWAEARLNDLDTVEDAVATAQEDDVRIGGPLREEGGLEAVMRAAGLEVVSSGLVDAPWAVPDDDSLVRGVLMGEDEATMARLAPVVVGAARPFRDGDGYLLRNAFRWAVGRTPR